MTLEQAAGVVAVFKALTNDLQWTRYTPSIVDYEPVEGGFAVEVSYQSAAGPGYFAMFTMSDFKCDLCRFLSERFST